MVWGIIIIISVGTSCWIVGSSWDRYSNNPIVISLEKDYRSWVTAVPSTTFCIPGKIDRGKAVATIKRIWNVTEKEKVEYYFKFIQLLSESSVNDMKSFEEFSTDETLKDIDFFNLTYSALSDRKSVKGDVAAAFNSQTVFSKWSLTEVGFCQSIFSHKAEELTASHSRRRVNDTTDASSLGYCDFLGKTCSQSSQLPGESEVYFYSALEVPDILTPKTRVGLRDEGVLRVESEAFVSSPDIRKLWPKQRRCYFSDENVYDNVKGYSYNICQMQCRQIVIYNLCKCSPHFYPSKDGYKICDIAGLVCIKKHEKEIGEETKPGGKFSCKCYPPCEEVAYARQDYVSKQFFVTSYTLSIQTLKKTRYSRQIIFEFSDLLVSFGGTAALFLGCSLITGIEIFYFFTIRLGRLIRRKAKSGKNFVRANLAKNITLRTKLLAR